MKDQVRLVLVAACALIDPQGRVLMAERPPGKALAGLWEFPGGKVEEGEKPEDALVRELREELGVAVRAAELEPFSFASHSYEQFHLLMPLYLCRLWEGEVTPLEGQQIAWTEASALPRLAVPPADGPLIAALLERGVLS